MSRLVSEVLLERRAYHWIMNAVLPTYLVVLFGCASYLIPPDDVSSRLSHILTLLLTQVALKFAVSFTLPVIPYLTLLDRYFVLSYVVLFIHGVLCTLSFLVGLANRRLSGDDLAKGEVESVGLIERDMIMGATIAVVRSLLSTRKAVYVH